MLFVLFGATGDLSRKKIFPALYHAFLDGESTVSPYLLGVGRSDWTDKHFHEVVHESLVEAGIETSAAKEWCEQSVSYHRVSDYANLGSLQRRAAVIESNQDLSGDRIFYLAVPPLTFPDIITQLGRQRSADPPKGHTRVVIEKPFGHNLESAIELNELIHEYFDEDEIYRIDHYLGKETVQNLLVFRFANAIFESLWNRNYVERIEITVAEEGGADGRAGYYDGVGALRDMVQNHLTQLLTLTAMEVPAQFDAEGIRQEKIKVLRSVLPIALEDVVRGQYTGGDGTEGYLDHDGVREDSRTETFVALRLFIQNWRWQGVPFLLRTGKRMEKRLTEIAVYFRRPPVHLFGGAETCGIDRNVLRIRLQPGEGFSLDFEVKQPAETLPGQIKLSTEKFDFSYDESFGRLPDAYETLLRDLVKGDQTLFVHADETEAAWRLYQPLLEADLAVEPYATGSWGPKSQRVSFLSNGESKRKRSTR